jgi:hypothetical protein
LALRARIVLASTSARTDVAVARELHLHHSVLRQEIRMQRQGRGKALFEAHKAYQKGALYSSKTKKHPAAA